MSNKRWAVCPPAPHFLFPSFSDWRISSVYCRPEVVALHWWSFKRLHPFEPSTTEGIPLAIAQLIRIGFVGQGRYPHCAKCVVRCSLHFCAHYGTSAVFMLVADQSLHSRRSCRKISTCVSRSSSQPYFWRATPNPFTFSFILRSGRNSSMKLSNEKCDACRLSSILLATSENRKAWVSEYVLHSNFF